MKEKRLWMLAATLVVAVLACFMLFWQQASSEIVCIPSDQTTTYFSQFRLVQIEQPKDEVVQQLPTPGEFLAQIEHIRKVVQTAVDQNNLLLDYPPAILRWQIHRSPVSPQQVKALPLGWCLEPLNRQEKTSLIHWVRYAIQEKDAWPLQRLANQPALSYAARWDDSTEVDPANISLSALDKYIGIHITEQTSCVSSAEANEGSFGILTGPWQNLDWPAPFSLETYQKYILLNFEKKSDEYFLDGLLVGAQDCCGLGGGIFVQWAFYYPGTPLLRYYVGAEECQ